jgi:hypothetical protein
VDGHGVSLAIGHIPDRGFDCGDRHEAAGTSFARPSSLGSFQSVQGAAGVGFEIGDYAVGLGAAADDAVDVCCTDVGGSESPIANLADFFDGGENRLRGALVETIRRVLHLLAGITFKRW